MEYKPQVMIARVQYLILYQVLGWSLGVNKSKFNFWTVITTQTPISNWPYLMNFRCPCGLASSFTLIVKKKSITYLYTQNWKPHFDLGLCQKVIFFALAYSLKASFCIRNWRQFSLQLNDGAQRNRFHIWKSCIQE